MKNHYNPRVALCKVIPIKESGKGLLVESGIQLMESGIQGNGHYYRLRVGGGGDLADPPFECYFTEVIPPNNI